MQTDCKFLRSLFTGILISGTRAHNFSSAKHESRSFWFFHAQNTCRETLHKTERERERECMCVCVCVRVRVRVCAWRLIMYENVPPACTLHLGRQKQSLPGSIPCPDLRLPPHSYGSLVCHIMCECACFSLSHTQFWVWLLMGQFGLQIQHQCSK